MESYALFVLLMSLLLLSLLLLLLYLLLLLLLFQWLCTVLSYFLIIWILMGFIISSAVLTGYHYRVFDKKSARLCFIKNNFSVLERRHSKVGRIGIFLQSNLSNTNTEWMEPSVRIREVCIYSYFEKGCRKKCTQQSRRVFWVVLSSMFFKEIWKNGTRGQHRRMFVSAKGKQQYKIRQLQCPEQRIDHIPYYRSGLSRHIFSDNLS